MIAILVEEDEVFQFLQKLAENKINYDWENFKECMFDYLKTAEILVDDADWESATEILASL